MQFFQKYTAEPSYAESSIESDSHAFIRSSDAQFAPDATNTTAAAVAFMHAGMHPLAPFTASAKVPGVWMYLTSTSLWYSLPKDYASVAGVVEGAQRQLQDGQGIEVLAIELLHQPINLCVRNTIPA